MSDIDAAYQKKVLDRQYPAIERTPEGALVVEITGAGPMPQGTSDQPSGSAMPKAQEQKVTEDQLRASPQFLQDVSSIYQAFTGKPWDKEPSQLADWGIEKLANFELAMGDMTNVTGDSSGGGMVGQAAQILQNFTPEQSGAFLRALESYDQLPNFTLPGFGRLVRNIGADPTTYAGLATVGAGLVGRQGARAATKEGVKQALRQRIGQALLTNPAKVAGVEAAAYAGTADALKQNVEVAGGKRNVVDPAQVALTAGVGAAAGAGMVKGVQLAAPYVGAAVKKGMENLAAPRAAKVGPGAQVGAVGDLSTPMRRAGDAAEAVGGGGQRVIPIADQAAIDAADQMPTSDIVKPYEKTVGVKFPDKQEAAFGRLVKKFPNEFTDKADMAAPTQVSTAQVTNKKSGITKERPSFESRLDEDGLGFMKWVRNNNGKTALQNNQKTGNSIDFSTSCVNRECKSGSCAYCYVYHARTLKDKFGEAAPAKLDRLENDYMGEVMRMPPSLIRAYNMDGGLRMFSFGDFRPGIDDENVARVLADAEKRGLYIKAITKEVELIKRFGNHPNFRLNVSIDNVPREISHAITLDEAIALRGQYPNLRIRVVALNRAELEMFGAKRQSDANPFGVNVITPYHGVTNWVWRGGKQKEYTGKLNDLVRADNPRIFETLGEEKAIAWLDTWENMGAKSVTAQEYQKKFSGFMCCTSGKCAGDNTKCGFATKVAEMGGVALMILGGSNSIFLGEADDNEVMWGGSI